MILYMITHSKNKVNDFLGEILLFLKFFIEFPGSRGAQSANPIVSRVRFIDQKNQNDGGRYALSVNFIRVNSFTFMQPTVIEFAPLGSLV